VELVTAQLFYTAQDHCEIVIVSQNWGDKYKWCVKSLSIWWISFRAVNDQWSK